MTEAGAGPAGAVLEAFRRRGWTLAVGESCTGGLVAKLLTDVPGSSQVVRGGVVAYHDDVKTELLDVPRDAIRGHGAVSEAVALALARGAATRLGATVGLGVTGIAGPGGATEDKPVGTVWLAVHGPDGSEARHRRFPGERERVRTLAAEEGLLLLLETANPGRREG